MNSRSHLALSADRALQRVTGLVPVLGRPGRTQLRRLVSIGLTLVLLVGCHESSANRPRRMRGGGEQIEDHVAKALEYLERVDSIEEKSANAQIAYQLNRWLDGQTVEGAWEVDAMAQRAPRAVRDRGTLDSVGRRRFDLDDIRHVQESVWFRQVASWVSRQSIDPQMAPWIESQRAKLGDQGTNQLATAYRLFDWTVRNIQLMELPPSPDEATAAPATNASGTGGAQAPATALEPGALRGVPGPGYQRDPGQTLLYGVGDFWQRMRVLTLLARQQGIEAVTLAFPGRQIPPRPRPWVTGVVIDKELYLFDLRLGLPIPGPDGVGVATLSQVTSTPSLLQPLVVAGRHEYSIAPEDLREVVALIDLVGPSLAQRMQLLERQFVGEHRTTLAVPATDLANRLRECRGVSDVYVWSIPFEAVWFRSSLEQRLQRDEQAAAMYFMQFGMFLSRSPLCRGRISYLRAEFDSENEQTGAKTFLMQARIPDENLNTLPTNEALQQQLGMFRNTSNEQQWQAQVTVFQNVLKQSKQHASFWLGMCQLEAGRLDAAQEWFLDRTLTPWPDGPWTSLARYNLARVYELRGNFAEAQRLLLADKSPQEHGNYLRAQRLQRLVEPAAPPAAGGQTPAAGGQTPVAGQSAGETKTAP